MHRVVVPCAPVSLLLILPALGSTAIRHEIWTELREDIHHIRQRFALDRAQHQGVALPLDNHVLRGLKNGEVFGDAYGQRVAAFEGFGLHGVVDEFY